MGGKKRMTLWSFMMLASLSAMAFTAVAQEKIAFIRFISGGEGYEIFKMDPDGTGQTQLTSGPGAPARPAFSPDLTRIVFDYQLGFDNPDIYVMNADGTGQTNLTNTDGYSCQDEPGGSGLALCVGTVANGAAIDTTTVGTHTFTVTATDNAGNSFSVTHTYRVVYDFTGLFHPVENLPTLNVVSAGGSVALKFSLAGDHGLGIFDAGYPSSSPIACDASDPSTDIEETISAGGSGLSYDAGADQYTYIWKTNRAWRGTCRMLVVNLNDGTQHLAKFRFR